MITTTSRSVAVLAIVALHLIARSSPLDAAEPRAYTKAELQQMYVTFLKGEGYSPEVDRDGDVNFKFEGVTYFIAVDEKDSAYFRLVCYPFWKIDGQAELERSLVAADYATRKTKVAKVYIVNDRVWTATEIFVASPGDFRAVFKRCLTALPASVTNFATRMREIQNATSDRGALSSPIAARF